MSKTVDYQLTRSRRRTLTLQVNREGELVVHAPFLYPKFLIDQFVSSKERWISKRHAELSRPQPTPTAILSIEELKDYIHTQLKYYEDLMHLYPRSTRFAQVNSYWGTCNPKGVLSFNLSLRFTSLDAIKYVVVHELAHLRYRGHGVRFWQLVNSTYPQANEMRRFLRQSGHAIT